MDSDPVKEAQRVAGEEEEQSMVDVNSGTMVAAGCVGLVPAMPVVGSGEDGWNKDFEDGIDKIPIEREVVDNEVVDAPIPACFYQPSVIVPKLGDR
ncbi:hypothetical protein ZWY2020_040277 [Hordeum vulgare]|nr:hypothetical protein ZWY2020_040277 [Hordeum vulgare]